MEESKVQGFYKSRNIFITGGTGFMGKVLIEKLLRSTEVSTIYLLIREKKGKNMHLRIDELFDDIIFDTLKGECPQFKHRIQAMAGDCSAPGLGLNISDKQKLISNINVVFHVAATVRFDENLKLAYAINVKGTKEVLDLARHMTDLKALIRVSTAYSNCSLKEVGEKIYDYNISYEEVGTVLEKLNNEEAAIITRRTIEPWPNTYAFTKALAESLINSTSLGLPVGVFRPSIIVSTYNEPLEGWTDNSYGATGVFKAAMFGLLRVLFIDKAVVGDIVPVDKCVAGLIVAAWDVATKNCDRTLPENIPVYNYVSSPENPITWEEFTYLNTIHGLNYPPLNALWFMTMTMTKNPFAYWFLTYFNHMLPAIVLDTAATLTGSKPRVIKMYKYVHKMLDLVGYFADRQWSFSNENIVNLWGKLSKADKEVFPLSITTVHWLIYSKRYMKGLRKYLAKESDSTLVLAKKWNRRFYIIDWVIKVVLIFLACMLINYLCHRIFSFVIYGVEFIYNRIVNIF